MKKQILALSMLCAIAASAQNVGVGTSTPSAKLDISSTNSGILIPRVVLTATTTAAPVTTPVTSMLVYNSNTNGSGATAVSPGFYYWTGSAWNRIVDFGSVAGLAVGGDVSGTITTVTVIGLEGKVLPALSAGFLKYNGSAWLFDNTAYLSNTLNSGNIFVGNVSNVATGVALSGDATIANTGALTLKNTGTAGTYLQVTTDAQGRVSSGNNTLPSTQVWLGNAANTATPTTLSGDITLSNTGVSTLKNTGTAGTYGSATQVPVMTTDAQGRVTGVTNTTIAGTVPGGTAGGDLSGTYPNPTVAKIDGATVPAAGALTPGNVLQVNGASALTYAPVNVAGGANYVTGILPTANGGMGANMTAGAIGAIPYSSSTTAYATLTAAAAGSLLVSGGAGVAPSWVLSTGTGIQGFWTRTGTNLYNTNTNDYIGIGTNAPASQLANSNINPIGYDGNGVNNANAIAWTASNSGYVAALYNAGTCASCNGLAIKLNAASTGKLLDLSVGAAASFAGSSTSILVALASGNVGIGTAAPASKLHVAGGGIQDLIVGNTGNVQQILMGNGSGYSSIQAILQGTATNILALNKGGGNVGIGTTAAGQTLTVVDASNANVYSGTLSVFANNLTQGVGIGYAGIQALGSNAAQTLYINARGTGNLVLQNTGTTGNVLIGDVTNNANPYILPAASGVFLRLGSTALPFQDVHSNYLYAHSSITVGGTSAPALPLDVVSTVSFNTSGMSHTSLINGTTYAGFTYVATNGGGNLAYVGSDGTYNMSIRSAGGIMAPTFFATSDARIKEVIGQTNGAEDLLALDAIRVTDYTLRDKIANGNTRYKKVLAQQVKEVYPLAVKTSPAPQFIPNIYQTATSYEMSGNTITVHLPKNLAQNKDIAVGKPCKLYLSEKNKSNKEQEVKGTITALSGDWISMTIDQSIDASQYGIAFVYGTEINDLLTVDYDAISMLNVSATQELYRIIKAQQDKIATLQSENSNVRSDIDRLKASVETLQQLVGGKAQR